MFVKMNAITVDNVEEEFKKYRAALLANASPKERMRMEKEFKESEALILPQELVDQMVDLLPDKL